MTMQGTESTAMKHSLLSNAGTSPLNGSAAPSTLEAVLNLKMLKSTRYDCHLLLSLHTKMPIVQYSQQPTKWHEGHVQAFPALSGDSAVNLLMHSFHTSKTLHVPLYELFPLEFCTQGSCVVNAWAAAWKAFCLEGIVYQCSAFKLLW